MTNLENTMKQTKQNPFKIDVNCQYDLDKYFEIDSYKIESKLDKVAQKYNGVETGSGAGFGVRDINFEFDNINNIKLFWKEAKKVLPILKINTMHLTYADKDNNYICGDEILSYLIGEKLGEK